MWLIVEQMLLKAGLQDASLSLQSRFYIRICNKLPGKLWMSLFSFSMTLPHVVFLFKLKWLKNGEVKDFMVTCFSLRIITFCIKISHIVFSVFISLDQNLIKLEKQSLYLFKGIYNSRVTKPSYTLWRYKPSYKLYFFLICQVSNSIWKKKL